MKSKIHNYQNKYLKMSTATLTLLAIFFISVSSFAQQGINYKAILKDTNGNVLADTYMTIQFTIHQGSATGTIVYQEDHTITTDDNGLLILNIGTDTTPVVGTFAALDWSTDIHFLQTSITYNGGTINFDATEFMVVPYAKHAETADNVFSGNYIDLTNQPVITPASGLEQITEETANNSGLFRTGWRLFGADPTKHGPIGNDAVDLSKQTYVSSIRGALGTNSLAVGFSTIASGNYSTAIGFNSIASESGATAIGQSPKATGTNSTALGAHTSARSYGEIAVGSNNTFYNPSSATEWISTDRIFVIGNGFNASSDALMVLKNGTVTAPSLTNNLINIAGNKALITKEYFDNNATGLKAILELGHWGWRLEGFIAENYGPIGDNAIDLSFSGSESTTRGATGEHSVAFGSYTTASGKYSTAIGQTTTASGIYSTALGYGTKAESFRSFAIGSNNIGGGYAGVPENPNSTVSWVETDPLFEIGNGRNARSNALTVLKNGKVGIGRHQPTSLLEVQHPNVAPTSTNLSNAFSIRNIENESWQFYTQYNGNLHLYNNGVYRGAFLGSSGAYTQTSDRRTKKDITSLENGTLEKVMQLNPVSYLMKAQTNTKRNIGLISQEVKELFPSITHYVEESDLITLSYTELIPILIKALQEQQGIIEAQKAKDIVQDKSIEALVTRLNLIETKSSN